MSSESEQHEQASSASLPEQDKASLLARRQFLKGTSLALPAVMTLTPGAAQAMVSITCGQKALDSDLTAECLLVPPDNTDDGMYRMPVTLYDRLVAELDEHGNPKLDANGNPVLVPTGEATYFMGLSNGETVWRDCSSGLPLGTEDPDDLNSSPNLMYPTGYAIVHIDAENGEIVSVGSPDNPSNAVITSAAGACMASLAMRAMQNP
ncbi:MAG: hypothetical protein ACU85V_18275 [Gammaproteobacteria bacterium]